MDFIQIAENLPTIIGAATSAVEAIDTALPAIDKLFADVDAQAKTDFANALSAIKALVAQVKTLFEASAAPATSTAL